MASRLMSVHLFRRRLEVTLWKATHCAVSWTLRTRFLLLGAVVLSLSVLASAGQLELHAAELPHKPLSKKHMPLMGQITKQIHANWNNIRTWQGRVELTRGDPALKKWKTVTEMSFVVDYVRDRRIVISTQTENMRDGKRQPFDVTGILLRDEEFYLYLGRNPDGPLRVANVSPIPNVEVEFKSLKDIPERQRHSKLVQGYLRKSPRSEFEFRHLDFGRNFDPIVAMTREGFRRPYIEGMLECLEKDVSYESRITFLHDGDRVTMKHALPSDLKKGREGYTYVYSLAHGGNLVYYFLDDGNGGTETAVEFEQVSGVWAPTKIDHRLRDVFVEHFIFLENKINEPLRTMRLIPRGSAPNRATSRTTRSPRHNRRCARRATRLRRRK